MPTEALPPSFNLLNPSSDVMNEIQQIGKNTNAYLKSLPHLKANHLPSISKLRDQSWPKDAVVLGRGPSFFQTDYLTTLKEAKADRPFTLLSADGSLAHCLAAGLVPDLTVTVDPSIRILRWFGDVYGVTAQDEYFLKDRDAPKQSKALIGREHVCGLTQMFGPRLRIALGVFTHQDVLARLEAIKAQLYMFIPMSDDEEMMKQLFDEYPDLPGLNVGGNVGSACYSLALALGHKRIALAGIDFGYPPGTPLEETQYFDLIAKQPDLAEKLFVTVRNPHLREAWFTDKIYLSYAIWLIQMAKAATGRGVETVNCTGGGIVAAPEIGWMNLTSFLAQTVTFGRVSGDDGAFWEIRKQ